MVAYAATGFGALALVLAGVCVYLSRADARSRREVAALAQALLAEKNRPPPEIPPRVVESRREAFALLWFPELTVDDNKRFVLSATAGLPHCPKCLRPMKLSPKPPEEWVCEECGDRRAGTAADFTVSDQIVSDTLKEFFARRPSYRPSPTLKLPKQAREAN